jgi:hypothetical protein
MRPRLAIYLPVLLFVLLVGQADARWFQRTAGPAELHQIARTLMAAPSGEIRNDISITRDPEAPAPPAQNTRRKHDPVLTAESAKSIVFAGPGLLTALIEVGLEAANAKAADLLPTPEEALYDAHAGETEEGTETKAVPAEGDKADAADEATDQPAGQDLPRIVTPFAP